MSATMSAAVLPGATVAAQVGVRGRCGTTVCAPASFSGRAGLRPLHTLKLSPPANTYAQRGQRRSAIRAEAGADVAELQQVLDQPGQVFSLPGGVGRITNSIAAPTMPQPSSNSIIVTTLNDVGNWARLSSLWPLMYGTSCCFIEFACLIGSRFDFDRYGLVPRASPRQADLIITAGTVTMKMAPALVRLYEQLPEPKYVIAMGACTITGGMFATDSYTTVRGVDKLIPVDVYLPGCPPKPEAVVDALVKLRKKVAQESLAERDFRKQTHRYYTTTHKFEQVPAVHTGEYLSNPARRAPSKQIAEAMGVPMSWALDDDEKKESLDALVAYQEAAEEMEVEKELALEREQDQA